MEIEDYETIDGEVFKKLSKWVEKHPSARLYAIAKYIKQNDGCDRTELCQALNIPRTTAYDYILLLTNSNLVYKEHERKLKCGRPRVLYHWNE